MANNSEIKIREEIAPREWSHCLGLLKEARYLLLRDSESFHEAATALEEIGRVVSGACGRGLGSYKSALLAVVGCSQKPGLDKIARNFEVIKEARNSAVHSGAWARHLSDRLIDFFLILESAIKKEISMKKHWCVEDIMVRNPVVAEGWHRMDHVRRVMLANSFSCLPILMNDKWHVITDAAVMRFLWCATSVKDPDSRHAMTVKEAIETSEIDLIAANTCLPSDIALKVAKEYFGTPQGRESLPVLVIENCTCGNTPIIFGILTVFDLL